MVPEANRLITIDGEGPAMNSIRAALVALILAGALNSGLAADPPDPVVDIKGHTQAVSAVAWAADGKSVATASDDRSIRVWDPNTGKQSVSLMKVAREGYGGPVVAFTADLKVVAVNYWGEVTIRTVADGKVLIKIDPILDRGRKSEFRPEVFAMAFSPDGKRLATAGSVAAVGGRHGLPGGTVIVWDAEGGKIVHQFDKLSTAASAVTWTTDGKRLVAGTSGAGGELQEAGEVWVWDTATGKALHSFSVKPTTEYGEWASAADVAVSPDGKRVAALVTAGSRAAPAGLIINDAGINDAGASVWELGTGAHTQPLKGLKASVGHVVFSPDGKRLATAGDDKVVRLWDEETGKELAALPGADRVTVVAFSPDGKFLAAGSKDGSLRIWAVLATK
jgi:WD40 repeat protein